jgi:HK97 family phage prohead protease
VKGRLLLELQRAREAYTLLKEGALGGLSIGYSPTRYSYDDAGVRHIAEVELWEVSLVTFPANAAAGITVVKSADAGYVRSGELIGLQDAIDRALSAIR